MAPAYCDTAEDDVIQLDDLFRTFLDEVGTKKLCPDFDSWLDDKLDVGPYDIAEVYLRIRTAGDRGARSVCFERHLVAMAHPFQPRRLSVWRRSPS